MTILLRFIIPAVALLLWVWVVLDVVRTPQERIQHLPKLAWLAFVVLFPPIGVVSWLIIGRPLPEGGQRLRPGPHPSSPVAPDDSPEFLARLDEEIKRRRRADELRKRRSDPDADDAEIDRLEDEFKDDGEEPQDP